MSSRIGIGLVILSSISFGAMALFARLAYAYGVSPTSLLFLRFGIAGLVMTAVVALRGGGFPRGRIALGLALMGGVGYVGQSLCFFTALTMANTGLVSLLLYLYPAIVAVLSVVLFRERLTPIRSVAVVLALFGTALTVGPQLEARPLGVLLGIASAVIYSGYIMAGTKLLKSASPLGGSAIIMVSAGSVFGIISAAQGITLPSSPFGWIAVAGVTLVSTVIAVTAFLIGLAAIGPTKASVLSTFEPVTTVLLAALLLQEPVTLWTGVGGVCILAAAIILARSSATPIPTGTGAKATG